MKYYISFVLFPQASEPSIIGFLILRSPIGMNWKAMDVRKFVNDIAYVRSPARPRKEHFFFLLITKFRFLATITLLPIARA